MERSRILTILTLVVCLFIGGTTTGCANTLYAEAVNLQTYQQSVTYEGTVIEDVDHRTHKPLKDKIIAGLKAYPKIQKHIKKVRMFEVIKTKDGIDLSGRAWLYKGVIELTVGGGNRNIKLIMATFYHEMGHIGHFYLLSLAQEREWFMMYAKKMESLGHSPKGLGDDWWKMHHKWEGVFPSQYCLHDYSEYLAEHFESHALYREWHKKHYKEEHELLVKHDMCPIKKECNDNKKISQ